MLTGSAHPAILTNSRWRAVSCIDPRLDEKCLVTAIVPGQHPNWGADIAAVSPYELSAFRQALESMLAL